MRAWGHNQLDIFLSLFHDFGNVDVGQRGRCAELGVTSDSCHNSLALPVKSFGSISRGRSWGGPGPPRSPRVRRPTRFRYKISRSDINSVEQSPL